MGQLFNDSAKIFDGIDLDEDAEIFMRKVSDIEDIALDDSDTGSTT